MLVRDTDFVHIIFNAFLVFNSSLKLKSELHTVSFFLPVLRDQGGQQITHPYIKPPRRGGIPRNESFSIEHPISGGDVRALTYIATLLGLSGKLRPLLVSDTEASSLLDSNFVSLGGPGSNYNRINSDWQLRCAPLPACYAERQWPKKNRFDIVKNVD